MKFASPSFLLLFIVKLNETSHDSHLNRGKVPSVAKWTLIRLQSVPFAMVSFHVYTVIGIEYAQESLCLFFFKFSRMRLCVRLYFVLETN